MVLIWIERCFELEPWTWWDVYKRQEQARQQAQQDRENARQELKEAVTRSQTMIEKATVEAKSVREEIVRKAKTEADDQIIRARGQIELELSLIHILPSFLIEMPWQRDVRNELTEEGEGKVNSVIKIVFWSVFNR